MTAFTPALIPSGRVTLDGVEHIIGPDGAKIPVKNVKPVHVMEDDLVRSEIGFAIGGAEPVDLTERLADRAHLGPGEAEAQVAEQFGIADRAALARGFGQDRANARGVAEREPVAVTA